MLAFEVMEDLFEAEGERGVHANGIVRRCPYQNGNWALQPAYAKAWSFIVDLVGREVWTRNLLPAVHQWDPQSLLAKFNDYAFPDEVRWLHCLRVSTSASDGTKFGTVVVDFMHPDLKYEERRMFLEPCMPELGIRKPLLTGGLYLVPEFPDSIGEDLWAGLHIMNSAWRESGGLSPFYSGIMSKAIDGKYQMQKHDQNIRTPKWMFHKFSDPFCHAPKVTL